MQKTIMLALLLACGAARALENAVCALRSVTARCATRSGCLAPGCHTPNSIKLTEKAQERSTRRWFRSYYRGAERGAAGCGCC